MSDVKLQRTLARFQAKIDSGSYYEAHQTLRTITNRYIKAKQYTEAIDLLYQGSSILASKGEFASASDLITYLIHTFEESGVVCSANKDSKLKLLELINLLPSSETSLIDLSKQAINWSVKGSENKFGDSDLHHLFGVKLLQSIEEGGSTSAGGEQSGAVKTEEDKYKLFTIAELHLILGTRESLPYYVNFLFQWYAQSPNANTTDPGLFLSRAIINYAYLKNLKFISEAQTIFIRKLLESKIVEDDAYTVIETPSGKFYDFKDFELVNFLQLLVITLGKQQEAGSKFMKLYQQNKPLLTKYEILPSVEYLGRFYFNLQIGNPSGNQNMLANLMGGLFK